jgi:hypothetical protein
MTTTHLTRTQRRLQRELSEIAALTMIDYEEIEKRPAAKRTAVLETMKREIVRGEVVGSYAMLDEAIGSKLCEYFFGSAEFIKLWRTRRFERFNYYVLERLSFLNKVALVRDVYEIPSPIPDRIEQLNNLRNAMAHNFFPENIRAFRELAKKQKRKATITWRGKDILTIDGLKTFIHDVEELRRFFAGQVRRKHRARMSTPASGSEGTTR